MTEVIISISFVEMLREIVAFIATDLETFLMPFKYPSTITFEDFVALQRTIKNDHYKAAVKRIFYEVQVLADATSWGSSQGNTIEEVESVVQSFDFALPFRNGYLRKGRKTKPKRQNQTRNGKAWKRQSPSVKKSTKVNPDKSKVKK
ncbi:hypothetical protein Tco_1370602 [Tanacetum coccineum]